MSLTRKRNKTRTRKLSRAEQAPPEAQAVGLIHETRLDHIKRNARKAAAWSTVDTMPFECQAAIKTLAQCVYSLCDILDARDRGSTEGL